jgi:hypothetical protein
MIKNTTILLFVIVLSKVGEVELQAQEKQVAQPTVMVVPYVDENKSNGKFDQALLEPSQRLAISIAEEELIANGLKTLSFQNLLKNQQKSDAFAAGDGGDNSAKEDIRDIISRNSGADIRIELDLTASGNPSTGNFKVKQTLRAIDPFTSEQLSLISVESGSYSFNDTAKIARRDLKEKMRGFIDLMQQSFTDRVNNGRDFVVEVIIDQTSELTMSSMLGDIDLGDLLYDYFEAQAFKGNLSEPKKESVKFTIDRFKVPLRDENGNPYRLSKLERGLKNLLKSKQVSAVITINGGKLNVVIKK